MQAVRFFHLDEQNPKAGERTVIPILLGDGATGQALVVDLTALPHLLVAGRTEAGKSACLHSIVVSILAMKTPSQVRLVLIDPKRTVFSRFRTVPHLLRPVVTDPNEADRVIDRAVKEMEWRQEEHRKRWEKPPSIVIVADEMADLIFASKEAENNIVRLAKSRLAVGIHLVLATRLENVNAMTGYVKAQIPTRDCVCHCVGTGQPGRSRSGNRRNSRTLCDHRTDVQRGIPADFLIGICEARGAPVRLNLPFSGV